MGKLNRKNLTVADLFPKIHDEQGNKLCRYCRKILTYKRLEWCSNACRDAAYVQVNPGLMRIYVKRRDKEICAHCGLNCVELSLALSLRWLYDVRHGDAAKEFKDALWDDLHKIGWDVDQRVAKGVRMWFHINNPLWHVHHIIPIAEGGDFGPDNVITLCIPCHKKVHGSTN